MKALEGIKVLDLTRVLAGPLCGALLGDLGATVIKIEVPGRGDDARAYGPYRNGESMYYANLNRTALDRGYALDYGRLLAYLSESVLFFLKNTLLMRHSKK